MIFQPCIKQHLLFNSSGSPSSPLLLSKLTPSAPLPATTPYCPPLSSSTGWFLLAALLLPPSLWLVRMWRNSLSVPGQEHFLSGRTVIVFISALGVERWEVCQQLVCNLNCIYFQIPSKIWKCPRGTYFNDNLGVCDWKINVSCQGSGH